MIRLVALLALAAIIVTLMVALVRDFRSRRRQALVERLRMAFLHGAPIAPPARVHSLQEIEVAGWRLRLPGSWPRLAAPAGDRLEFRFAPADGVMLAMEAAPAQAEPSSSPERLENGAALAKGVTVQGEADRRLAVYEWRLLAPQGGVVARLSVPLASAEGVLRQSDVFAVDRSLREAQR